MGTEPLNLPSLRKQQRRVAALLNRQRRDLPYHSIKRREIPLAATFPVGEHWCTRLDIQGSHQNPALKFLRQGLRYAKKTTKFPVMDFGKMHREKPTKLVSKSLPEKSQSAIVDDNGYVSDTNRSAPGSGNVIHGDKLPAVACGNSSGLGKSTASDFDYGTFQREITQSLDGNETQSFALPSIILEQPKRKMTPPKPLSPVKTLEMFRRRTTPIKIPTESEADKSLPGSPTKFVTRTRTFYSSVPDTTSRNEGIDFDNFRANLEYQHGVPPLVDDKIRSLLESRQGSRRQSGAASGNLLTVDRLETGDGSRWCSCGYRPSLSSAKQCSECNHVSFHEPSCSKYSRENIPVCPRCGKPMRLDGNSAKATSSVVSKSLERALTKTNTRNVERESTNSYLLGRTNGAQKGSSVKARLGGPQVSNVRNQHETPEENDNDEKVMINGRLQTPDSYLMSIERGIRSGKFDSRNVDINVEDIGKVSKTPDCMSRTADVRDPTPEADDTSENNKVDWNSDVYKIAYIRALADARAKSLPDFPEFLSMRTTRAFVFSYYEHVPFDCNCAKCMMPSWDTPAGNGKSEMKMIFGDVNPDDYLPGGRKGPKVKRKRAKTKSIEVPLPKMEKIPEKAIRLKMTKKL